MKKIYIILTYTGTMLSKLVKIYTKDEFAHVSISLDEDLTQMYSFGRLTPYNPFFGGFVHEQVNEGTFKRFKKTKSAIYSMQVEDEEYNKIKDIIKEFQDSEKPYKFNIIGLLAVGFNIKIQKEYSFYCAEFVKYVLENAGIKTKLPELIKPGEFRNLNDIKLEYKGILRDYKSTVSI